MNVKAAGSVKPTQKTRRVILKRPVTATADNGLTGSIANQATQMFDCWRFISRDFSTELIAEATGLSTAFIREMEQRFRGN